MIGRKITPSTEFIEAILQGYQDELAENGQPQVADIWNRIIMRYIREKKRLDSLFVWDKSHSGPKNRIRDIAETIKQGYVPPLALTHDGRKELIVTIPQQT